MTDEKIMSTIKPDGEYWQPELETMPREQLQQLQVKKLKKSIEIALQSPFYKKRLGDAGITADSINSLDDLRKIPTVWYVVVWMMPFVSTLPVVQRVIPVSWSIPSTTSAHGQT